MSSMLVVTDSSWELMGTRRKFLGLVEEIRSKTCHQLIGLSPIDLTKKIVGQMFCCSSQPYPSFRWGASLTRKAPDELLRIHGKLISLPPEHPALAVLVEKCAFKSLHDMIRVTESAMHLRARTGSPVMLVAQELLTSKNL